MHVMKKTAVVGAALFALTAFGAEAAPIPSPLTGAATAAPATSLIEHVQYVWGGRGYCWYPGGWRGPGWYWCGYAWRTGFGWGGPAGWRGWYWRGGYGPGWGPGWRGGYGWHRGWGPGWHGGWHGGGWHHGWHH